MTSGPPLPDRWHSRDFPILLETARRLDAGEDVIDATDVASHLGLDSQEVARTLLALGRAEYLEVGHNQMLSGDIFAAASEITERGRRAVGLWPDQEQAADALIDLLTKAADHVDDEDDAGALKKAGRLLRSVPSAVLADVTAALIRQQSGIG